MKHWKIERRVTFWPSPFGRVGDVTRSVLGSLRIHDLTLPSYGVRMDWWGTVNQPHARLTGIGLLFGRKGVLWVWPVRFVRRTR